MVRAKINQAEKKMIMQGEKMKAKRKNIQRWDRIGTNYTTKDNKKDLEKELEDELYDEEGEGMSLSAEEYSELECLKVAAERVIHLTEKLLNKHDGGTNGKEKQEHEVQE